MRTLFKKTQTDGKPSIRVRRTLEGTLFEAIALLLIVVLWVVAVWGYRHSPETIGTHFNLSGQADGFGSRSSLIIVAVIGTFTTLFTLACAYAPSRTVHLPVRVTNVRQQALAARMTRVCALQVALIFICAELMMGFPDKRFPLYLLYASVALMILVPLFFIVLVVRNRQ